MLSSARRALKLVGSVRPANHREATFGMRCFSSNVDTDAQSQAAKQWTPSVDPFTSAMQSKAEKELLDQVLRQAEEQEQAEDAAEQVWCKQYVCWSLCTLAQWEFLSMSSGQACRCCNRNVLSSVGSMVDLKARNQHALVTGRKVDGVMISDCLNSRLQTSLGIIAQNLHLSTVVAVLSISRLCVCVCVYVCVCVCVCGMCVFGESILQYYVCCNIHMLFQISFCIDQDIRI